MCKKSNDNNACENSDDYDNNISNNDKGDKDYYNDNDDNNACENYDDYDNNISNNDKGDKDYYNDNNNR